MNLRKTFDIAFGAIASGCSVFACSDGTSALLLYVLALRSAYICKRNIQS